MWDASFWCDYLRDGAFTFANYGRENYRIICGTEHRFGHSQMSTCLSLSITNESVKHHLSYYFFKGVVLFG